MRAFFDRCLDAVPRLGAWRRAARELEALRRAVGPFAPGHFYSPIPSPADVEAAIRRAPDAVEGQDGIDLRGPEQRRLLRELARFYAEQPFPEQRRPDCRYHLDNRTFCFPDGIVLYCMMRHLAPRHIIEVGSGLSSAAMLETNERFLGGRMRLTLVEPYPDRLAELGRSGDSEKVELLMLPVQEVPLARFLELGPGDVLFIDSSHVGKASSDVLFLLFEVLPRLRTGVVVHFHDVFPYFEYPAEWLRFGTFWNEAYLLRAFLQWNRRFRIDLWVPWALRREAEWAKEHMPLCTRDPGGSLWLTVVD